MTITPLEFIIWFFIILIATVIIFAVVTVFKRRWASERRQQMRDEITILKGKRQELDRLSQTQASLLYLKMVGKDVTGISSDSERESLRRITSLVHHFLDEEMKAKIGEDVQYGMIDDPECPRHRAPWWEMPHRRTGNRYCQRYDYQDPYQTIQCPQIGDEL